MEIEVQIRQKEFEEAVARKNYQYTELAEKLGVNSIYLSNIKNSNRPEFRPSAKLRKKIMKILEVEFDEVFTVMDSQNKVNN